jgi:hypothetical protein
MPKSLYIRHLPGEGEKLIDDNRLPANNVAFNPSFASPILYMRGVKQIELGEENYIILYNTKTNLSHTIEGLANILQKNVNLYQGLEDLRICNYIDKLWFVATTTHASSSMNSEVVIGYFNNQNTRIETISYIPLGKPPIKNICPFVYNSKLALFDIYTKQIYEVIDKTTCNTTDNGKLTSKSNKFSTRILYNITCGSGLDIDNFRGSTSPVHLHGNLYGCIVHDIIFNDSVQQIRPLAYMHYWIEIDMSNGQVTFVSSPFWVINFGIEFISGIDIKDDNVDLYLGVQDKIAIKYTTTLSFLRSGK